MNLERLAERLVGQTDLDSVQTRLAEAMLVAALRRTSGNFTHAAALLGVSRQVIQHMVTRFNLREFAAGLRNNPAQTLLMRI
jgi:transcriptional regulator of acetoin/glycerol metabolism